MAAKKNGLKAFEITAKFIACSNYTLHAESFEHAVEMAKELSITDFITFSGDHLDSEFGIQGVSAYPNGIDMKDGTVI